MTVPELVDGLVSDPVLVFGSLPPEARDLDLLARPPQLNELRGGLAAAGFHEHGGEWVRFRDCTADVLDLVPADEWQLPAEAVAQLFADALPLPGARYLVRPAPHHLLLIIACRVSAERSGLSGKRRRRIAHALEEMVDAWAAAERDAPTWHAETALTQLRDLYAQPEQRETAAAKRPHLVAFSGVDGAGKTSQIEALHRALQQLGLRTDEEYVRIEWMTLTGNRLLSLVAAPVKAVLRATRKDATGGREDAARAADTTRASPDRDRFVSYAWSIVVAAAHARVQRRAARERAADIVICDRYTLDARVYLRYRYGGGRRLRAACAIVEHLSRTPLRSFYLAIAPDRALARKAEQYGLAELTDLVRLYEDEYRRVGAVRLDAERPQEELCREVALDVWRALRARP